MAMVDRIIGAESGGDPFARNPRSSAGGAGQFIDSTWLEMVKRYRPDIAQGKTDAQLLQLKYDPNLSREMTEAYGNQNADFLKSKGIEPTDGNVYLAHFAGPGGAAAIHADPGATVEALLGEKAVAANPFLRGKRGQDVIDWASRKMTPAQSMARSIRQRYGGGQSEPAAPAEAPSTSAGVDRLKSLLSGNYDAGALSRADQFLQGGAETAKGARNWIDVVNSALQTGLGTYEKHYGEGAKRKDYQEQQRQALTQTDDVLQMAKVLLASPDPEDRAAGIQLYAQASRAAKSNPEAYGTSPQYYKDPETGEVRVGQLSNRGGFKPANIPGQVLPGVQFQDLGTTVGGFDKRTGQPVTSIPKDVSGEEKAKAVGKGQGAAAINLPDVEGAADRILRQVSGVKNDPNLPNVTGWESYLPTFRSKNIDTEKKIGQLHGSAFLQAFQDLKGAGAITEAEGSKATEAYARLETAQSDEGFVQALKDFEYEVQQLVQLARRKAGVEAAPPPDGGGANVDALKQKYGLE